MKNTLCIGLTPTVQELREFKTFQLGEVNRSPAVHRSAAGKGANVARVLRQLGGQPLLLGFVGGATGEFFTANLRREGVAEERIKLVGNIMIDSLIENLPMSRQSSILNRLGLKSGQFAFVTLHRPSNVDGKESLTANMAEVERLAARVPVVFPIHPRTRKMLGEFGIMPSEGKGLQLIDPIGYHDSLCLTENARLLLTDSGGLQEEATYFRTPCLTLRPSTERPVTVTMGSNRLTNLDRLAADIEEFLGGPERRGVIPPLWDGRTARRTLDEIIGASRR